MGPLETLGALEGRWALVKCFQSWCPGCHSSGFPTLKKVIEAYGENNDVAIATVQTTFEGFSTNDEAAALRAPASFHELKPEPEGSRALKKRNLRT